MDLLLQDYSVYDWGFFVFFGFIGELFLDLFTDASTFLSTSTCHNFYIVAFTLVPSSLYSGQRFRRLEQITR